MRPRHPTRIPSNFRGDAGVWQKFWNWVAKRLADSIPGKNARSNGIFHILLLIISGPQELWMGIVFGRDTLKLTHMIYDTANLGARTDRPPS
jgi:hypothetical protein